jgi:N-acetylglutamate synthase-like GNAT family acetyltransferase
MIRKIRHDAGSVARWLESDEPRTSPLICGLLQYPERRNRRAWTVLDRSGATAAVLVMVRQCFDYWTAHVYLADPSAAPAVAGLLDRSPAIAVMGAADDVRPLAELVTRAYDVTVSRWAVVPHPVEGILGPPTDRTRVATMADLPALVDLYASYEYVQVPTRWQLRGYLLRLLRRHLVIVCEVDASIVGATAFDGQTNSFVVINDMTVLPDYREAGIGWELTKHAQAIAVERGVGASLVLASSNPMSSSDERVEWSSDRYYTLPMRRARRFKGQTRLRRLYRRFQPIVPREPVELAPGGSAP